MGIDLPFVVTLFAIAVMAYCLWLVVKLRPTIPGGVIGKRWNTLLGLVAIFAVGYLTTPFMRAIPEEALRFIVAGIFFFGALYVLLTVKLLHRVIVELTA